MFGIGGLLICVDIKSANWDLELLNAKAGLIDVLLLLEFDVENGRNLARGDWGRKFLG